MALKSRRLRRWQFSMGVIAPAALLLVLTAVGVLAFVIWSAHGVDQRALLREQDRVARAITQQIAEVPHAQESIALWDDAVEATRTRFDKEWIDNNLGIWMHDYYGFDAVAIVSDLDQPIYTMVAGEAPSAQWFEAEWPAISPLVTEIREKLAAGALEEFVDGSAYPRAVDIKTVAGRPAIVSAMPITGEAGTSTQAPGTEYLHVAVDYLDADFAARFDGTHNFDGARFATAATTSSELASHPLFDSTGRVAALLEWQPSRPGVELLNQSGPVLATGFLIAAILVAILVNRLWTSSSALEAERVAIKHLANHDTLTGLPNRTQFDTQLARDLGDRRGGRPPVALLILDLDRFKHVNDTLGHDAGDALICAVGQRLKELIGPADILARLGGDEFAIIHLCSEGPKGAMKLANAVVEAVAKPFDVLGSEAFVGASVGVAVAGRDDHEPRELARKADIALYEAKANGRNRAVEYREAMNVQLQDRHMIEAELREALRRNDQLTVAFQPLFDGDSDELAGAEALARWRHPTLGQVSPARFIPIAENAGLIETLGEYVLRRACAFGARWPGRRIAVNISPVQLRNPRFAERVFDLMVETAMRPSDLELEITEGILLDNDGPALEAITAFRNAGIRIALDDFGTGYSSLNYLKRYPVDSIKIDRSFVAQLVPKSTSVAIVQAMVTLAHALEIEVTAEGVETHEQMSILKEMGCNLFQGFLLAAPADEQVVEARFRRATERRRGVRQVA